MFKKAQMQSESDEQLIEVIRLKIRSNEILKTQTNNIALEDGGDYMKERFSTMVKAMVKAILFVFFGIDIKAAR